MVDLQCSCAEAVHGLQQASVVQPCPTSMICKKIHLRQEQRFDITALIKSISAIRPAGPGRTCFDAVLIDGRTKEAMAENMMLMKVTLFQADDSTQHTEFSTCVNEKRPVTLLQMQGSKSSKDEYSFQSAFKGWRMVAASAEQPGADKAKSLMDSAAVLLAAENTEEFASKTYKRKEYKDIPGTETTVQLLLSLPCENSGIPDLDEEESVWQINLARIHEPQCRNQFEPRTENAFGSKQPFAIIRCNTHCIWGRRLLYK